MKPNVQLMKLLTKLLIMMMLFVMLFLISAFMYSARYWPDIYHYIHSNVTLKRIPTLSELNLTILEYDNSTDNYSTTDVYGFTGVTAGDDFFDVDIDEFTNISEEEVVKREIRIEDTNKDYSLLPDKRVVDYFFLYDEVTTRIMKDLVDEDKLTTRDMQDVEMVTEIYDKDKKLKRMADDKSLYNVSEVVFPWISAIFIISDNNSRYDYFCDGALLSENVILTAARCVNIHGKTVEPNNILIILGKRSLQASGTDEKAVKVKEINIHENFTSDSDNPENDLAILILEERIQLSNSIQVARLPKPEEYNIADQAVTTGWNASGDLTLIYFEKKDIGPCDEANKVKNVFCATYDKEVKVCPSYGSLYVVQSKDTWYLHGVLTGDTTDRGICVDRSVDYTDLTNYIEWVWGIVNKHEI